jgi:hypothetical protein
VDVVVVAASFAGGDSSFEICITDSPEDLMIVLPGADAGGVWSPALTSGTGVFDPSVDPTGTYTYTVAGTSPCPSDAADVDVIVNALPNAGTDAAHDFCSNDASYDLYDDLGVADVGGTWTPTMTSGTGVFDPADDAAGAYVYTVDGGGCPDVFATVTVGVENFISAGSDSLYKTCEKQGSIDLTVLLSADADAGGTWTDDDGTGALTGSVFDFSLVASPGTYSFTYHQANTAPCENDSALITVQMLDCTGIDEAESATMRVYPNPTSGMLTIDVGTTTVGLVSVLSQTGQLLGSYETGTIDVSHLAPGMYYLKVTTANGIVVGRFEKQ